MLLKMFEKSQLRIHLAFEFWANWQSHRRLQTAQHATFLSTEHCHACCDDEVLAALCLSGAGVTDLGSPVPPGFQDHPGSPSLDLKLISLGFGGCDGHDKWNVLLSCDMLVNRWWSNFPNGTPRMCRFRVLRGQYWVPIPTMSNY